MADRSIKTAIVIPVYNRRDITLQGLKSLSRIDLTGLDLRIFIVDADSPDGTAAAVRKEFPDVAVIDVDSSLHYAAGTNRGIKAAVEWGAEYIAAMNDDAVFHPQFLQRLIRTSQANPRSIIGGLLLLWDRPHQVFQVDIKWKTLKGGWDVPNDLTAFTVPQTAFEVEGMVGNCVLIPAAAINECGLMDEEKFPHGWGDAQYFARMSKKGWKMMVEPKAYVWCEPNTYPTALHAMPLGKRINTLLFNRRHPQNLHRHFIALWESAPSKLSAAAAFGIVCGRLGLKAVRLLPIDERR